MTATPTVRRGHRMPFGALPLDDGGTRFRLWSPGADRVELWLEEPKRAVPMPRDAGSGSGQEEPADAKYARAQLRAAGQA